MKEEKKFSVFTYSTGNSTHTYVHWAKGLTMQITKDGHSMKLNSDEIQKIVKSLPRTVSGRY